MAEKKDETTTKAKATSTDVEGEKVEYSEDSIEYIDKGDHWEVHDRRLGDDRVSNLPKTSRDIPLPKEEQEALEERIVAENEAAEVRAEAAEAPPEAPPVEEKSDVTVTAASGSAKS